MMSIQLLDDNFDKVFSRVPSYLWNKRHIPYNKIYLFLIWLIDQALEVCRWLIILVWMFVWRLQFFCLGPIFYFINYLNFCAGLGEELGEDIVDFGKKHIYKSCPIPWKIADILCSCHWYNYFALPNYMELITCNYYCTVCTSWYCRLL